MQAAKASEPMTDKRPGELVTVVNIKTGQRVTVYPVDAAEFCDPKRNPEHADWVAEGHRLDPGVEASAGESAATAAPQTVADLTPPPPPLPGRPKADKSK